jgi:hypothetical protein
MHKKKKQQLNLKPVKFELTDPKPIWCRLKSLYLATASGKSVLGTVEKLLRVVNHTTADRPSGDTFVQVLCKPKK